MDADRKIQTACLLILTAIGLGFALHFLRPVLIPFVMAIFLVYCLAPIIDVQVKHLKFNRGAAVVITILLGCLLALGVWHLIWESVGELNEKSQDYERQMQALVTDIGNRLPLERFGVEPEQLQSFMSLPQGSIRGVVGGMIGAIMSFLSNGLLVIIFMIFIMAGKSGPPPSEASLRGQIESRVKKYIVTKVLISALTGICVGLTLTVLKVPFALAFGVLAFLMNFIPSIGSVIATLLPLPVVMLSDQLGPVAKILALAIPGVVQFAVGNLIEPKIMGGSLGLHPVVILLGLIFFGMIWGILGMFLATPIVAVIKIILERIEVARPVAMMLEGKWEDTPAEVPA